MLVAMSAVMIIGSASMAGADDHCISVGNAPALGNGGSYTFNVDFTFETDSWEVDVTVTRVGNSGNYRFSWDVDAPSGAQVSGTYTQGIGRSFGPASSGGPIQNGGVITNIVVCPVAADAPSAGNSTPVSTGGVTPSIISGQNPGGNRTCEEAGSYDNNPDQMNQSGANNGVTGPFTWSHNGTYLTWSSAPGSHDGLAVIMKGGAAANVYYYDGTWDGDSGLASPPAGFSGNPAGLSNLTFCWNDPEVTTTTVEDTTTTTVEDTTTTTAAEDTTTTTVAGPDETTTTAGDTTTTTVAGPGDPELPDTGAGLLLGALAGGLGLLLMGSGSLVIASERRRYTGF